MTDRSLGELELRWAKGPDEVRACATIMATSEPWVTLGRDYEASLAVVTNPDREVWVAVHNGIVLGFIVLAMRGGFPGYIQSIGVQQGWRGRGIGARLMERVETRVFEETPNVFLCVSSFNPRARAFYEACGYQQIGTVEGYIVAGHDEHIMRKTRGPVFGYVAPRVEAPPAD